MPDKLSLSSFKACEGITTSGFTLIEILVVLVIISIVMTFVVASFGDFGQNREIVAEGKYLRQYIELAKQEAILDDVTLAVHIDSSGYEILRFKEPNSWQPIQSALFHHHPFKKRITIQLNTKNHTRLIIHPSGQISPFELHLGTTSEPNIITLSGKADGSLSVKNP